MNPLQASILSALTSRPQTATEIGNLIGRSSRSTATALGWMRGARLVDDGSGFRALVDHKVIEEWPVADWYDEDKPLWVVMSNEKLAAFKRLDKKRKTAKGTVSVVFS